MCVLNYIYVQQGNYILRVIDWTNIHILRASSEIIVQS